MNNNIPEFLYKVLNALKNFYRFINFVTIGFQKYQSVSDSTLLFYYDFGS